ncbi:hypothetical protein [Pseudoxanthomonas dokdonensis]|uniref:Uncharacterized protein n=1 Tax=Pseudoxanthomonas dokdonensis TaxID=344882 RepID=A0A0R0CJQ9_9GAMM|nr:hypothetical protein [Pseudoxanthomonas dokdonensis]KRG70156.1 hypothetical protein ABB29_08035 [Pseudoxanthomonas dokdonensis]
MKTGKPHQLQPRYISNGAIITSIVVRLALLIVACGVAFVALNMAALAGGNDTSKTTSHISVILAAAALVFLLSSVIALCLPLTVYRDYLPIWGKCLLATGVLQLFLLWGALIAIAIF